MIEKRFVGSSGGVYDQYKGDRFTWSEWEEILQLMNNLDEKARERSKALSKLQKKNEQLKEDNIGLIKILENQSIIIAELHSKILDFELKEPIVLTKEDLELMGKAISYYTHGRYVE